MRIFFFFFFSCSLQWLQRMEHPWWWQSLFCWLAFSWQDVPMRPMWWSGLMTGTPWRQWYSSCPPRWLTSRPDRPYTRLGLVSSYAIPFRKKDRKEGRQKEKKKEGRKREKQRQTDIKKNQERERKGGGRESVSNVCWALVPWVFSCLSYTFTQEHTSEHKPMPLWTTQWYPWLKTKNIFSSPIL